MARRLKIAAAQYPIDELVDLAQLEEKLSRWVVEAASHGAQLLIFPEYGGMELTRLAGRAVAADLHASIAAMQHHIADYERIFSALARQHGVFIVAGSLPVRVGEGTFVNRARLHGPHGGTGFQDKLIMTRFENEQWGISPGAGLNVFDIGIAKLGIAICYDSEFPLIARTLAESGAEILAVPSCTDTHAGYNRVRCASAARALENQFYVAQAPTIGEANWSAAVDVNVGAAGVFTAPDNGLSDTGIVALGELNRPGWVYADFNLEKITALREDGEVFLWRDWSRQPAAPTLPKAELLAVS